MKTEIPYPFPHNDCFFCGCDSPEGLKLTFLWDDEREEASAEYLPERRFVGQGDILHGAIQMGLLDEAMGWACIVRTEKRTVTSDTNVKFHRPVYIRGTLITVTSRLTGIDGPWVSLSAEITDSEGTVCTSATATFHIMSDEKYDALVHNPAE